MLLAVAAIWALLFLPNAGLPSLFYEEGRHALASQNMLAGGDWLRPQVLGIDFLAKPPLLFWLIAAGGRIMGGIGEWSVRLPGLLAVLATALAVAAWLRPRVAAPVAVIGGGAFLLNPTIMEKAALGEPDTLVTCFVFAAYLVWADGRRGGSWWPVLACGALLGAASLAKQPLMLGFFALAGGLLLAAERAPRAAWLRLLVCAALGALPALAWFAAVRQPGDEALAVYLARLYPPLPFHLFRVARGYGEFLAETLPWCLAAIPALLPATRRRLGIAAEPARLVACYALACPLFVAFWPVVEPRYLMPALPALAAAAALAIDALWRHRALRLAATGALLALGAAQLSYRLVALPLFPDWTRASALAAERLDEAMAGEALPVVMIGDLHNVAWYLRERPRQVPDDALAGLPLPCWALVAPIHQPAVMQAFPAAREAARMEMPYALVLLRLAAPGP